MAHQVTYDKRVYSDLKKLPKNIAKKLIDAVDSRLGFEPARFGKRLRRSLAGLWRM